MGHQAKLDGNGASLSLQTSGKPYLSEDFTDPLLTIDVRSDCGGYSGCDQYVFKSSAVRSFAAELAAKQDSLEPGSVTLNDIDESFSLELSYGAMGNIEVSVEQAHGGATYVSYKSKFFTDQSYAAEFLRDLQRLVSLLGS